MKRSDVFAIGDGGFWTDLLNND